MDCKKIRDLLLADYSDNELDASSKADVEAHLNGCALCREFAERLKQKVLVPLRAMTEVEPSESVWRRIEAEIAAEEAEEEYAERPVLAGVFAVLQRMLLAHRPAFVLSSLVTAVLIGYLVMQIPVHNQRLAGMYLKEQAYFLVNGKGTSALGVSVDFGTNIEEFLF